MDETRENTILESAWKRYAELDAAAIKMTGQHLSLRKWMSILGVVATFLAVFLEQFPNLDFYPQLDIQRTLQLVLVTIPITISGLAAYTNKFLRNGEWLTLRATAEEILKEIYTYRTVIQDREKRDDYLSQRLTTILRRVYKSLGGQLVLEPFENTVPPYYYKEDDKSDPGFNDLTGEEYLKYRLINQRNWHRDKLKEKQRERTRIQLTVLLMGGFGALFAALGKGWIPWVAITAAIASTMNLWEQLRGLDETIMIYSRLTLELTFIRDKYVSVPPQSRTIEHFKTMVREAESVMWAQNQKYVASMQEALAAVDGDDADKLNKLLSEHQEPHLHESEMMQRAITHTHPIHEPIVPVQEPADEIMDTGQDPGQILEDAQPPSEDISQNPLGNALSDIFGNPEEDQGELKG